MLGVNDDSSDEDEIGYPPEHTSVPTSVPSFQDASAVTQAEWERMDIEVPKEAKRLKLEIAEIEEAASNREALERAEAGRIREQRDIISGLVDRGEWKTTCMGEVVQEKAKEWEAWKAMSRKARGEKETTALALPHGPFTSDHVSTLVEAIMPLHNVRKGEDLFMWPRFVLAVLLPRMMRCIVNLRDPSRQLNTREYKRYMRSFLGH